MGKAHADADEHQDQDGQADGDVDVLDAVLGGRVVRHAALVHVPAQAQLDDD